MIKIHVLEPFIYNRISAGEVVERPASVVKELVENSIDAGATEIDVSIEGGGITNMTVTDNGCGIGAEFIETAFLPHATSKIERLDDLDMISTLGFRGEALASIASVSEIELITKSVDEPIGSKIMLSGGVVSGKQPYGGNNGCRISVSHLFFNTPARAKFLKKPAYEQAEVSEVMRQIIFANPHLTIRYTADGKVIYRHTGGDLSSAVRCVYPREIADRLIEVSADFEQIRIFGLISDATLTKPNRNFQTTIVNGRTVKDNTVAAAIREAYGNTLMKRAYPVFILNIVIAFDELDVNVHPSKTEVRFRDAKKVFSGVFRAVKSALEKNHAVFSADISGNASATPIQTPQKQSDKAPFEDLRQMRIPLALNTDSFSSVADSGGVRGLDKSDLSATAADILEDVKKGIAQTSPKIVLQEDKPAQQLRFYPFEEKTNIKIIGQVFDTYLLVEQSDTLYFIDQHAAQEKMKYDAYLSQMSNTQIDAQLLLVPEIVSLHPLEYVWILERADALRKLGFEIEEFGDHCIKVSAIPAVLGQCDVSVFINLILQEKLKLKEIGLEDLFKDIVAQKACKASIKAGDRLDQEEIAMFIDKLRTQQPVQCPHGRPVIVEMSKNAVEKFFKRVL